MVQPIDQFEDEDGAALQGAERALLVGSGGIDEAKLSESFLRRASRVQEELAELGDGAATTSFRDVGNDGDRGADELVAAGKRAGAAKGLGEGRGIAGDAGCDLGDQESTGIGAKNHTRSLPRSGP